MHKLTFLLLTIALVAMASTVYGQSSIIMRDGETSLTNIGQADNIYVMAKDMWTSRKLVALGTYVTVVDTQKCLVTAGAGLCYRPQSSIWNNGTFVNIPVSGMYALSPHSVLMAKVDNFVSLGVKNPGFTTYELGFAQDTGIADSAILVSVGREALSDYRRIGLIVPIHDTNLGLMLARYEGDIKSWAIGLIFL
ncbi:MAG: hypothetical protein WCP03_04510 [Candidatus Saccharibacteria bacterium]